MSKTKLKKYMARVEYLAVKDEAEKMYAQGYSMRDIYTTLTGAGKITMSETSLCDYIKGSGERRHAPKNKTKAALKAWSNRPGKRAEQSDKTIFSHNNLPNLDELEPNK